MRRPNPDRSDSVRELVPLDLVERCKRGDEAAWKELVELAERVSGEPPESVSRFFARGTLLTILMSMNVFERPAPWSERLVAGCQAQTEA